MNQQNRGYKGWYSHSLIQGCSKLKDFRCQTITQGCLRGSTETSTVIQVFICLLKPELQHGDPCVFMHALQVDAEKNVLEWSMKLVWCITEILLKDSTTTGAFFRSWHLIPSVCPELFRITVDSLYWSVIAILSPSIRCFSFTGVCNQLT